jgi:hypothetical protein
MGEITEIEVLTKLCNDGTISEEFMDVCLDIGYHV